jgi:lysozyme
LSATLEDLVAAFVAPWEASSGPILTAYQDVADVWTIGYGTTYYEVEGSTEQLPITDGMVWTAAQCMDALAVGVESTVSVVASANECHPWNDNEIVSLCSLCYNIGVSAYRSSSVLKFHNEGNKTAAAAAFLLWDKAHVDGQLVTVDGLLNRRKAEAAKYLSQEA